MMTSVRSTWYFDGRKSDTSTNTIGNSRTARTIFLRSFTRSTGQLANRRFMLESLGQPAFKCKRAIEVSQTQAWAPLLRTGKLTIHTLSFLDLNPPQVFPLWLSLAKPKPCTQRPELRLHLACVSETPNVD